MIITIILLTFLLPYSVYILWLSTFDNTTRTVNNYDLTTKFSIVIPYRNNQDSISNLITALNNQYYPQDNFEILIINDHSTLRINDPNTRNLSVLDLNNQTGKKNAIQLGIENSKHNWIITIDADCTVKPNYLQSINSIINNSNANLVAGPVSTFHSNSSLRLFEKIDVLSLQAITWAHFTFNKPFISSGANLAFQKQKFNEIKSEYNSVDSPSGDDVFLTQIFTKHQFNLAFNNSPDAIVETKGTESVFQLIEQRIRWGSKTKLYLKPWYKLIAVITLLANIAWICLIFKSLITNSLSLLLISITFKVVPEIVTLKKANKLFEIQRFNKALILGILFHPFFITITALLSIISGYKWKGRQYK